LSSVFHNYTKNVCELGLYNILWHTWILHYHPITIVNVHHVVSLIDLFSIQIRFRKTEGAIKNEQSRDTGNTGTQDTRRRQTNIKQKLKAMHILLTKYGIYIFISK
jgi:hypothetical protein